MGVYQAIIGTDLISAGCHHCCFCHFFVSTFTFAFVLTGIQSLGFLIFLGLLKLVIFLLCEDFRTIEANTLHNIINLMWNIGLTSSRCSKWLGHWAMFVVQVSHFIFSLIVLSQGSLNPPSFGFPLFVGTFIRTPVRSHPSRSKWRIACERAYPQC